MKRPVLLAIALATALPLLAEEAKKPQTPATQTAPAEDSPLVRAAKAANRQGKKPAHVITNETLKSSKGHVTTTTVQRSVNIPEPEPGKSEAEAAEAAKKKAEEARLRVVGEAEARKSAEARRQATAAAAEAAEQGAYDSLDVDPAAAEHAAEEAAKPKQEKPPQR